MSQIRNCNFYNYHQGELGPNQLRQSAKSIRIFEALEAQQPNRDILVVPAQFGKLHGGKSVRRAREVMNSFEFGLGAFAVSCMLLTHPERLQHAEDLWVDCAGDEFSSDADGDFDKAPCLDFQDRLLAFATKSVDDASEHFGSASGFLPQL